MLAVAFLHWTGTLEVTQGIVMNRKKMVVVIAMLPLGGVTALGLDLFRGAATGAHPPMLMSALPISEPASLVWFGAGLWALALVRRRRAPERHV
jgi:hypothetical protein